MSSCLLYSRLVNVNVFSLNIAERFSKSVDFISGKGDGDILSISQNYVLYLFGFFNFETLVSRLIR